MLCTDVLNTPLVSLYDSSEPIILNKKQLKNQKKNQKKKMKKQAEQQVDDEETKEPEKAKISRKEVLVQQMREKLT